jgi:hypothetical protein
VLRRKAPLGVPPARSAAAGLDLEPIKVLRNAEVAGVSEGRAFHLVYGLLTVISYPRDNPNL